MAATIPRIDVTNVWQSANALSGIAAGTASKMQHTGGAAVDVVLAAAEPTAQDQSIGEQIRTTEWFSVAALEAEVWVKTASPMAGTVARLSFQANE